MIYLDNAATTPIHPLVLEAMLPYLKEEYGNAGALYGLGRRAANAVIKARKQVADLIGCSPKHIVFTSGGSEANNLAIHGVLLYLLGKGRTHIVTSAAEHDSVLKAVRSICNPLCRNTENNIKHNFCASFAGVGKNGTVIIDKLKEMVTGRTGLVSVMYVNNETGAINPVKEIAGVCQEQGALFHTDCVQALGFQDINVEEIGCDFLSISSHKINAPKGVGALYVRDQNALSPIINGGTEQEFGYRGGTENVAGIVGFGEACSLIEKETADVRRGQLSVLKSEFERMLNRNLTLFGLNDILHVNSPEASKLLNLRFDGVDGQTLVLMLDSNGVCISAGSACRSHEAAPSHVLLSMGLTAAEARNSVRVSFSPSQSKGEVRRAAIAIAECTAILKGVALKGGA